MHYDLELGLQPVVSTSGFNMGYYPEHLYKDADDDPDDEDEDEYEYRDEDEEYD